MQACVGLWNRASARYEDAGSPFGPADEGDNVSRWLLHRIEAVEYLQAAEELLGPHECSD